MGIAHLLFFDIWYLIRLSHWWASINWYWRFDKIQMSILFIESRLTIIYPLLFILTIFLLSIFELELIDRFIFLKRFSCEICILLRLRDWFGKFVLLEFNADALVFLFFRHRSLPSTLASYVLEEVGNVLAVWFWIFASLLLLYSFDIFVSSDASSDGFWLSWRDIWRCLKFLILQADLLMMFFFGYSLSYWPFLGFPHW